MQKMHKIFRMLVIMISLLAPKAMFGMDNQDQPITQAECDICRNKNPLKTKGVNKTITTWQKKRTYNLTLPPILLTLSTQTQYQEKMVAHDIVQGQWHLPMYQ